MLYTDSGLSKSICTETDEIEEAHTKILSRLKKINFEFAFSPKDIHEVLEPAKVTDEELRSIVDRRAAVVIQKYARMYLTRKRVSFLLKWRSILRRLVVLHNLDAHIYQGRFNRTKYYGLGGLMAYLRKRCKEEGKYRLATEYYKYRCWLRFFFLLKQNCVANKLLQLK